MSKRFQRLFVVAALCLGLWPRADARAQRAGAEIPNSKLDAERRPEIKIVYWYDRKRPLETFHHQVYDLRKGEFTPEVERWLAMIQRDFPGYTAYTQPLKLSLLPGENENYRVGDAVVQEFLVIAAQNGVDLGGFAPRGGSSSWRYRSPLLTISPPPQNPAPRPLPRFTPGFPGSVSMPSMPFPVPYPRPHP